jgi:uncharacterized protein (DUF952 family)
MMKAMTYHLTATDVWRSQSGGAEYLPEAFPLDGFIHCTDGEQEVLAAGNRHCLGDPRPYCLLSIATSRLTSPVRYDDERLIFPHIYGPLNIGAVDEVRSVIRAADGTFVAVGDPIE